MGHFAFRTNLIREVKRNAEYFEWAGLRFWRLVRYGSAPSYFREALSKRRGGVGGMIRRFQYGLLVHLGRHREAREAARAVVRAAPDDDFSYMALHRANLVMRATEEADRAMQRVVELRAARLPATLAAGLARIRLAPDVTVSNAALDWAWRNVAPPDAERAVWERAARFGAASDQLLWDWAYCARDRIEQLDALILPLSDREERLLTLRNRGALLIGAHVGIPFAGVHFLRPRIARIRLMGRGAKSVVLDNEDYVIDSEPRFSLRAMLQAIDGGVSIGLLADEQVGGNMVETVLPGGLPMKLTRWIPKAIWKHRIDSLYCFPVWEGDRIRILLDDDTPIPEDGEPYAAWEKRWADAYREKVLAIMRTGPENLRLLGGLWHQF